MSIMYGKFPKRSKYKVRKNYYASVILYLFTPAIKLYVKLLNIKKKSEKETWQTGLILGPTHIGDLLYFTSSLKTLSERVPNCKWYCVAEKYSSQIMLNNPYIEGIIQITNLTDLSSKKSDAYKEIKSISPDVVLIMMRNNYWPYLVLSTKLKIPNRVGYGDKGLEYLLTQIISTPKKLMPHAAYYRQIVEEVIGCKDNSDLRPILYPTQEDEIFSANFLETIFPKLELPFVAIYATAKTSKSNWSIEYYSEFIQLLTKRKSCKIFLFGPKSDLETLHLIAPINSEFIYISAGTFTLHQLALIISKALFVFGPDSGPRHIANSVKVPVFYIPNIYESNENGVYCETEYNLIPKKNFVQIDEGVNLLKDITPQKTLNFILAILNSNSFAL